MTYMFIAIAIVGAVIAGWGLYASHCVRKPWDIAAALASLAGLTAFLIGILLAVLPDFFTT